MASVEPLEPRKLLSASHAAVGAVTLHSNAVFLHRSASAPAAVTSTVQGYSPSQIRTAYGFDKVGFSNGSVAADGAGQTIAIVDAFNDPNIASDLAVFDAQFGLAAPPGLKVVNQTGGGKLPSSAGDNAAGWAGEISLDVEWAHAVAPGANILLVESNSDSLDDLLAGVKYAASAPGVSVVSMSWGGSEFFGFNGNEFSGETQYDSVFTTPAGHQGVTFVAAAGDSGASQGVEWPSVSPNVLSVGGTSLSLQQDGTYVSESSWNGTNGGVSQVETEPSYQSGVQSTGVRTAPDVSYDGDPNTGFAVYDSVPYQGESGWEVVGGTSAGSPQWAALVAIANQGRALTGKATLNGASQTLPLLYSAYAAPGTSGYSGYSSVFNDVTDTGGSGPFRYRYGGYGGYFSNPATAGYDTATGLGTPEAAGVIDTLAGISATSTSTPAPTATPSPTSTTATPQQLPASPVSAQFVSSLPGSVLGGVAGSVRLLLTNTGGTTFNGPVKITLYASADSTAADGTAVATLSIPKLDLKAGASKKVKLKFTYPTDLSDGSYDLVASVDATGTGTAPSTPVSASSVTVAQPTVDLATTFGDQTAVAVNPGQSTSVTVTLQNLGNVTATGTVAINLYGALGQVLDLNADLLLASVPSRRIKLRPGQSKSIRIRFVAPQDAGGTYNLIASASSSTTPEDGNSSNDAAVIATM